MSAQDWTVHDVADPDWTGALQQLLSGARRGLVVRSLLPASAAQALVTELEADRELTRVPMGSRFVGESLGLGLDRAIDERRAAYLDAAEQLRRRLRTLPGEPLDQLLGATLQRLASPLSLTLAADTSGRCFAPLVFRRLPHGGRIPPHAELEQLGRAPYAEFGKRLNGSTILSFFVCLQAATAGGALRVHELAWQDYDHRHDFRGHTNPTAQLAGKGWYEPDVTTGSLVVFDSGRWFHEVTPVEGDKTRWTCGGFIARWLAEDALAYWS